MNAAKCNQIWPKFGLWAKKDSLLDFLVAMALFLAFVQWFNAQIMQFDGNLYILLWFEAHFAPILIQENGKIKAHKQSGNGTSHKQQQNWLNFVPMAFVWQSFDVIFAECFHFPCAAFLFLFHQKISAHFLINCRCADENFCWANTNCTRFLSQHSFVVENGWGAVKQKNMWSKKPNKTQNICLIVVFIETVSCEISGRMQADTHTKFGI